MSPTIHDGTIAAAGSYRRLVAARRAYGQRTYGDRHLDRLDLAANIVQEAADCLVYVRLERDRWQRRRHDLQHLARQLKAVDRLAQQLGAMCEDVARHLAGEQAPLADVFQERWEFGQRTYGDAHLERDNLAESLEEAADIQILALLELDRREKTNRLRPADRALLAVIDSQAIRFAEAVMDLRGRVLAAPGPPAA